MIQLRTASCRSARPNSNGSMASIRVAAAAGSSAARAWSIASGSRPAAANHSSARRMAVPLRCTGEAGAQDVGEVVVVAEPGALVVERHDEQVGSVEVVEGPLGVGATNRWLPANAATKAAGSGWALMASPAGCSPAAQLSVRSTSAATCVRSSGSRMPPTSSPHASSTSKPRSAARTSTSSPRPRIRANGNGGSSRVASTSRTPGGRWSIRKPTAACTAAERITW